MIRVRPLLFILTLLLSACGGEEDNIVRECVLLQPNQEVKLLRDFQYARHRFFELGVIDGVDYAEPGDSLKTFLLYKSMDLENPNFTKAVAYPNSLQPESASDSLTRWFRLLSFGYEYELIMEVESGSFTLVFPKALPEIDTTAIACYMQIRKLSGEVLTFGSVVELPFKLQLIKFADPQPTDQLWDAEWKNVYDLGPAPLSWHSMNIELIRAPFGLEDPQHSYYRDQNGLSYLYLLGLDKESPFSEDTAGDGRVDNDPKLLWLEQGLLVFPSRTPFADPVLSEQVPELYATDDLGELVTSSKYYMRVTKSGYLRSVRLWHINLIEGSDRVEVAGVLQTRGVHYFIDYQVGEIEFLSDDIVNSNGPIQICYEYEKFF